MCILVSNLSVCRKFENYSFSNVLAFPSICADHSTSAFVAPPPFHHIKGRDLRFHLVFSFLFSLSMLKWTSSTAPLTNSSNSPRIKESSTTASTTSSWSSSKGRNSARSSRREKKTRRDWIAWRSMRMNKRSWWSFWWEGREKWRIFSSRRRLSPNFESFCSWNNRSLGRRKRFRRSMQWVSPFYENFIDDVFLEDNLQAKEDEFDEKLRTSVYEITSILAESGSISNIFYLYHLKILVFLTKSSFSRRNHGTGVERIQGAWAQESLRQKIRRGSSAEKRNHRSAGKVGAEKWVPFLSRLKTRYFQDELIRRRNWIWSGRRTRARHVVCWNWISRNSRDSSKEFLLDHLRNKHSYCAFYGNKVLRKIFK